MAWYSLPVMVMEAHMKTARSGIASSLITMIIGISANAYGQEVPADVWKAAREGLRDFLWIERTDPKVVPKYPDGAVVPNVKESYLGAPYKPLLITDEAMLRCEDPSDILKTASEDGYVFPILNNGAVIAFFSVKYLYIVERGVNRWIWSGMGLQSEYELRYYELLDAFPLSEGYAVFVVFWENRHNRLFLIKTPAGALQVYPGSGFIADLLEMSDIRVKSGVPIDANELLDSLKSVSVKSIATKQRLEKETKEWQRQMTDSLEKENE
jgi:hypothetical protein